MATTIRVLAGAPASSRSIGISLFITILIGARSGGGKACPASLAGRVGRRRSCDDAPAQSLDLPDPSNARIWPALCSLLGGSVCLVEACRAKRRQHHFARSPSGSRSGAQGEGKRFIFVTARGDGAAVLGRQSA